METFAHIAENAYKSLSKRMNATADEIQEVTDEIVLQQQAYNRYIQEANSIGISNQLKELVQSGAIDITQYDQETAKLIQEYEEFYKKALDCAAAVEELHEALSELYTSRFEMVQSDAEAQIALLEHMTNSYSNSLDLIEAKGYLGGRALYGKMAGVQSELIQKYKTEISDLQILMSEAVGSGEMDVGSEEYYAMQQSINEVKESLQEAQIAFEDYNNSMRQVNWDVFDYLEDRIAKIIDESNFLINLIGDSDLFDDNGKFNENGNAVIGLHAINYNTYMAQADQYAKEIQSINQELATDPLDTALIERKEQLIKLQQDSILAAEDEKSAIKDLVESGINEELSAIKELIDEYTKSLDAEQNLYNYQKKVKKQTKELASLQKQLSAYQNDTSEENKARIQKLQVDLESAQEDLQETQYNQYIKDQKELLSNLYDDYEEVMNRRLDDVDALISDLIDDVNANASSIRDTIQDVSGDVGYSLTESMSDILSASSSRDIVSMYGENFSSQLTTINSAISSIEGLVSRIVNAGDDVAEQSISTTTPTTEVIPQEAPITPTPTTPHPTTPITPTPEPPQQKVEIFGGGWNVRTGASTKYKSIGTVHTGDKFEYGGESTSGWNSIIYKGEKRWVSKKGSKLVGYSSGGIVADMQKMAFDNGDDMITVNTLKKGEGILTPAQTVQFRKFAEKLPQLQGIIDTSSILGNMISENGVSNVNQIQYNVGGISFPIEHVQDYNDLVTQMQNDARFEKFIQSMTVDRIVGGSRFAKYKQRFTDN